MIWLLLVLFSIYVVILTWPIKSEENDIMGDTITSKLKEIEDKFNDLLLSKKVSRDSFLEAKDKCLRVVEQGGKRVKHGAEPNESHNRMVKELETIFEELKNVGNGS